MSDFVFKIINANHHTEHWTFNLPDGNQLHVYFDLKRVSESVSPLLGK